MMMAPGGGLVLLKAGVRVLIIGIVRDWTTAEYVAGIAARHDTSHRAWLSSSSVTSMCAKMLSRFWLTGAGDVPVLMIHQLLVASLT